MPTTEEVATWRGQDLRSSDDEKLGTIQEIYLDTDTREPEWALITTGMFGTKQSFVPLHEASPAGDGVTVPFGKAAVKDAPKIDPDGQLSQPEEAELYRHYGLQYGENQSGSGLAESGTTPDAAGGVTDRSHDEDLIAADGRDVPGPTTDDAMTRSEEELRVDTTERESGRVRLRKYVVEDEVTQTVPVRREEVRVEREPITDANVDDATSGPEISVRGARGRAARGGARRREARRRQGARAAGQGRRGRRAHRVEGRPARGDRDRRRRQAV